MSSIFTAAFIKQIPKTDLHLHLDGSLRIPTLIELARAQQVELPSYEEAGLKELVFKEQYNDLPDYLTGFALTCAVMKDKESLERIAYELAQDNIAEGVRYIEVRFAPHLHVHARLTFEEVVGAVCKGLDKAAREHRAGMPEGDIPFAFGVILCALRRFNADYSPYYQSLYSTLTFAPEKLIWAEASLETARAAASLANEKGLPVVGFDLAGEEAGYPAVYHKRAFQYAHSHFIKKTVHAGEAYGPESIFQAITQCYANRIGHGTFLFAADSIKEPGITDPEKYVKHLVEYIASQRITMEVNLTSNLQTIPSISSVSEHPVQQMLDNELSVSICTDNRLVSGTTVCNELQLLADHVNITPRQFRNVIIAGFKGSFYPGAYKDKRVYVRQAIDAYDAAAAAAGISSQ